VAARFVGSGVGAQQLEARARAVLRGAGGACLLVSARQPQLVRRLFPDAA
jgi:hypothetical protein